MTEQSTKNINFLGGPEKRIRYRLGLGSMKRIKLEELLEIAAILGYTVEYCDVKHWLLDSDSYYSIFTGFSKLVIYSFDYDIAQDADGYVTDIFEDRGEYADFGIGRLLAWIFKYNKMKALFLPDSVGEPKISFPNNRETRIRNLLGLAEQKQFNRDQVLKLANIHGYKERHCEKNNANQFSVYPKNADGLAMNHYFQVTLGDNDMIESIVLGNQR